MANEIDIEDKIAQIYEKLDEGFYPEEYHKFTRSIEKLLGEVEELASSMGNELRAAKRKTGVLNLYPEDFCKTNDWVAVCEQMDVDPDVSQMTIQTLSVESVRGVDSEEE